MYEGNMTLLYYPRKQTTKKKRFKTLFLDDHEKSRVILGSSNQGLSLYRLQSNVIISS